MSGKKSKKHAKKTKLVRDSFTIPKSEYAAIEQLKERAIALGTSIKKSELLRAGLKMLTALSDAAFKNALSAVPTLKTGRPATNPPAPAAAPRRRPAKPAAKGPAASRSKKAAPRSAPKTVAATHKPGAKSVKAARPATAATRKSAPASAAPARKAAARKRPAPRAVKTAKA